MTYGAVITCTIITVIILAIAGMIGYAAEDLTGFCAIVVPCYNTPHYC